MTSIYIESITSFSLSDPIIGLYISYTTVLNLFQSVLRNISICAEETVQYLILTGASCFKNGNQNPTPPPFLAHAYLLYKHLSHQKVCDIHITQTSILMVRIRNTTLPTNFQAHFSHRSNTRCHNAHSKIRKKTYA